MMEDNLWAAYDSIVNQRRSIRKFKSEKFPNESIEKALASALLAPNSSNVQAWDFYWVQNVEKKKELIEACLSQ